MDKHLREIERELEERLATIAKLNPHQMFGVWEGCGKQVVQTRYYELVKEHHPDRYGGNVSSRVKQLSQDMFLEIQKSYKQLTKLEPGAQRNAPPAEQRSSAISRLAERASQAPAQTRESNALRDVIPPPQSEGLAGGPSEVFEAVTVSQRDASTLEEDSMPEEERREKLARLARVARTKPPIRATPRALAKPESLEEESAISHEERNEKLARLSARSKITTNPAVVANMAARAASSPSTSRATDLAPPPSADGASSGVRGLAANIAARQTEVPSHREAFTRGVGELRAQHYDKAFEAIQTAYELQPEDPLYKTYYAYALFMAKPEEKKKSQELLRKVIDGKHRQALVDAHLFLGYILKTYEDERHQNEAQRNFSAVLALNPSHHEAAREVRLFQMRKQQSPAPKIQDDVGGFISRLFKK